MHVRVEIVAPRAVGVLMLGLVSGCSGEKPRDLSALTGDSGAIPEPLPPSIAGIDPPLGDPLGGQPVEISGDGLLGATILIGDQPCSEIEPIDPRSVRCLAPALPEGLWDVAVESEAGRARFSGGYESWSPLSIADVRLFRSDMGALTAGEPELAPIWTLIAGSSPWRPRDGAGLVYAFGRLWLIGGWDPSGPPEWSGQPTTNEVWVSDDGGRSFSLALAHDPSPPESGPGARFGPRHTAGFLAHTVGGVEYLYVIGGDIYDGGTPDVWRSADGNVWERLTASAPWGPRVLHMVGVYQGDLYVAGGQTDANDRESALSDVWRSSDGGSTWERLEDAPWAPRGMVYGLVEHEGYLWLAGGGTYDDSERSYYSDVWRFDGEQWTEVLADGSAPWAARQYHNVFAWGGELWISSGYGADDQNRGDVWHSPDGALWSELPAQAFAPGHADGLAVTPEGPVHASGNAFDTEVFLLQELSSAPLVQWVDQGVASRLLLPLLAAPARVESAFGALPGIQIAGSAHLTLDAWEPLPEGRSTFFIGATLRAREPLGFVNAAQTVVGDSLGSCRAQLGYGGDRAQLVVTDAEGDPSGGQISRGEDLTDGSAHLIGFTFAPNQPARIYIDGLEAGEEWSGVYDSAYMGWDTVGAGFAGDAPAHVLLGAVIVAPAVLSGEDLAKLALWARRWGTPGP